MQKPVRLTSCLIGPPPPTRCSLCSGNTHMWEIKSSGLVFYMGAMKTPPLYFREACRVSRTCR